MASADVRKSRSCGSVVQFDTSHHLERMRQRELIKRRPSKEDARGPIVVLTSLGRTTIERAALHHVASVRRHLFDALTAEQTTQLADIVKAILDTNHHDPN